MEYAQKICSLVHSIRKASKIKVRTPLSRILLPVLDEKFAARVKTTEDIIKAEVNVKAVEYIDDASGLLVKKVKPNFARLGKQYGSRMKEVSAIIHSFTADDIKTIEKRGSLLKGEFNLTVEDVIISSEDIPGWSVATDGSVTVALDITISEELKREGIARDFVNRIQNLRKDMGLEVLDKITIEIVSDQSANGHHQAIKEYQSFISNETQALGIEFKDKVEGAVPLDMDDLVMQVKVAVKNK
jgi:isoleucyl-tRNA synthetase